MDEAKMEPSCEIALDELGKCVQTAEDVIWEAINRYQKTCRQERESTLQDIRDAARYASLSGYPAETDILDAYRSGRLSQGEKKNLMELYKDRAKKLEQAVSESSHRETRVIELLKYALEEINHYRSCATMLDSLIRCFERKGDKK